MQLRRIMIVTLALGLIAVFALAQEPDTNLEFWGKGPASHLMTKDEQKAWKKLKTQDEYKEFIAFFWAKRDPTPETPQNEFRDEMDRRVAFANDAFTSGRTVRSRRRRSTR